MLAYCSKKGEGGVVLLSVRKKKIGNSIIYKKSLMKNNQIQSHDILCNISNFILDGHNRKGLKFFVIV